MPEERPSLDLQADCGSCFGLCCVVPAFAASADFAIDKEAGQACPNLTQVQLNAAKGDSATKFPPALTRPAYWTTAASGSSQI